MPTGLHSQGIETDCGGEDLVHAGNGDPALPGNEGLGEGRVLEIEADFGGT
jgi:hypothetical protein